MRRLVLALALLAGPLVALPADKTSTRVAELQAGVICAPEVIGQEPAPDTVAGVSNVIAEDPPFVSETRLVPAVIDVGFAIKARLAAEVLTDLTVLVTHPPMGPEQVTRQSFSTALDNLDLSVVAWQFEYDYELVEGTWTVAVTDGSEILYSVSFEVVAPQLVPELAAACGYEALLS
jgi:hypothetical protein